MEAFRAMLADISSWFYLWLRMRQISCSENDKLLLLQIHSKIRQKCSKEVNLVCRALTFLPPACAILSRGPE